MSRVALRELAVERVNPRFGGRHGENQPTFADIDGSEAKNIAKEGPVRLRISAVKQEMSADNHAAEYIRIDRGRLTNFAAALKIEYWTRRSSSSLLPYSESAGSGPARRFPFRVILPFCKRGGVAQVVRATVS